jgi:integrase
MKDAIMIFSMLITAGATGVIAWYAIANHILSSNISLRDEEYRQQTSDLFQAIVISNILSDPEARLGNVKLDHNIEAFKKIYKGKTPIYLVENDGACERPQERRSFKRQGVAWTFNGSIRGSKKEGIMACITKRGDRLVIDYYDNQGKRRRKTLQKGTTKTKAKEVLRDIEDRLSKGTYIPENKIPTFAEVAKDWLEYKKPNVRASTWAVYDGYTRNHFHELDRIRINRITASTIEKYISSRQKQRVHIKTLRTLLMTVGQIMSYAVRHRYISYNPVRDIERPKSRGKVKKQMIRVLTPTEINDLFQAEESLKYRTLFMLAIFSGARQGELLGLKWSDVDWTNNQIHVQRTFNHMTWYDTKTETSNRRIDLGPLMMIALKKWKLACPISELDLIFPNESGNPINKDNMCYRYFNPALKKAGLKNLRFHDLRHTYASLLIEQGENIKYIQTQLGHSNPTMTLNVYAHLMRPYNPESAQRLENSIFKPDGHNLVTNKKNG